MLHRMDSEPISVSYMREIQGIVDKYADQGLSPVEISGGLGMIQRQYEFDGFMTAYEESFDDEDLDDEIGGKGFENPYGV